MLILERPHTTNELVLLARSGGHYARPIRSWLTDLRIEDFMPDETLYGHSSLVARLPDVAGQAGRWLLIPGGHVQGVGGDAEARRLLAAGGCVQLPATQRDELWEAAGGCPWWEWAACLDRNDQWIKAPKRHRANEPSAEQIDELLDQLPENRDSVDVISPLTRSYQQRLAAV